MWAPGPALGLGLTLGLLTLGDGDGRTVLGLRHDLLSLVTTVPSAWGARPACSDVAPAPPSPELVVARRPDRAREAAFTSRNLMLRAGP